MSTATRFSRGLSHCGPMASASLAGAAPGCAGPVSDRPRFAASRIGATSVRPYTPRFSRYVIPATAPNKSETIR